MKAILYSCGALLLSAAMLPQPAQAQAAAGPKTDATQSSMESQIQQLRDALAAQQKQIAEQQAKIDAMARQLEAQQPHPPNLSEVAGTMPVIPAGKAISGESLPVSLGQVEKPPAANPPAGDSINVAQGKIKLGMVTYGDWGIYPETGYGPQFLTQTNPPGAGNDNWNAFQITRTYLNFLFIPSKYLTFRVTPNLYLASDGNLNLRMKYAYAEINNLFSGALKDDNIRLGQQTNPLVDWEEGLYGYRFVSLTPWNFISLSSTHAGVSINGPIKGSNGKQYLDYQLGVFNNGSFHNAELSSGKQFMARLSFYPAGATSKYQGLGLTGFFDIGKSNTLPSAAGYTQYRMAALAHFTTASDSAGIAFEYDRGKNAAGSGNLFSTGTRPSGADVDFNNLAKFLLDQPLAKDTTQQGIDIFGHVNLGSPKWALFGTYQLFQPNTAVANNPLDFSHVVAGIAYRMNKNLRFAFDNQDILWRNGQATFSAAQASAYVPTAIGYKNVVGKDIKAFFINMELTF